MTRTWRDFLRLPSSALASVADPPASSRSLGLASRALIARELAERALSPADPLSHGSAEAVACDLERQSLYWALLAQRESSKEEAPSTKAAPTLVALLDGSHRHLLLDGAGGEKELERLRAELAPASFVELSEMESPTLRELASIARRTTDALLRPLETARVKLERRWVRGLAAVLGVLALVVITVFVVRAVMEWRDERRELAAQATWTASSRYPEGGCGPREQRCASSPNFFFCTGEEERPWIVLDLGKTFTVSGIAVENRLDGYTGRAVPLVVEVSNDKVRWTEVARKSGDFTSWRTRFPKKRARFVKLYVARRSFLHLSAIRVLP